VYKCYAEPCNVAVVGLAITRGHDGISVPPILRHFTPHHISSTKEKKWITIITPGAWPTNHSPT
jgi:hypothetical protein